MKMEQNTNTFSGKPQPEAAPHCFHDDLAGRMEQCGHILYHCMGAQRGQGKILRILSAQGDMSQKDLQDTLGIQPGSMSEIPAKLENKGYLVRVRDEADKRKILLSITDQGRQAVACHNSTAVQQRRDALFSALTPEERTQLQHLLDTLLADWTQRFDRDRQGRRTRPEEKKDTAAF